MHNFYRRVQLNKYLRLIRFDKPIGTLLLLWPTLWALLIAFHGVIHFKIYLAFVLGVFLTRSAGCAINDFADAKFDSQVKRTKLRPLVTGELRGRDAIYVTILLSVLALLLAVFCLQGKTLLWTIPALLIFTTYPFFKRFFPIPQLYLAIAFSIGMLMAFVEANLGVNLIALLLFTANLFWVLAYDTIYALVDIDDDVQIGIKTSAVTFGRFVNLIIICCYVLFILLMIIVGILANLTAIYWVSLIVACILIAKVVVEIKDKQRDKCFKAFLFNLCLYEREKYKTNFERRSR